MALSRRSDIGRCSSGSTGAAMVEMAVATIVTLFLILMVVDFVRYSYVANALASGAQQGLTLSSFIPGLEKAGGTNEFTSAEAAVKVRARERPSAFLGGYFASPDTLTINVVVPPADASGSRDNAFRTEPIAVSLEADLPLFTFGLLQPIRVVGRAVGFREQRVTGSFPVPLDCSGQPLLPGQTANCPTCTPPSFVNPATGQCVCPPCMTILPGQTQGPPPNCLCSCPPQPGQFFTQDPFNPLLCSCNRRELALHCQSFTPPRRIDAARCQCGLACPNNLVLAADGATCVCPADLTCAAPQRVLIGTSHGQQICFCGCEQPPAHTWPPGTQYSNSQCRFFCTNQNLQIARPDGSIFCCTGGLVANPARTECVPPTCPNGRIFNAGLGRCVCSTPATCTDPALPTADLCSCQCPNTAGIVSNWSNGSLQCICANPAHSLVTVNGITICRCLNPPPCSGGRLTDGCQCDCIPETAAIDPPGNAAGVCCRPPLTYDPATNKCACTITVCNGQPFNNSECSCKCPPGTQTLTFVENGNTIIFCSRTGGAN